VVGVRTKQEERKVAEKEEKDKNPLEDLMGGLEGLEGLDGLLKGLGGSKNEEEGGFLDALPGMLMMAKVFLAMGEGVADQVRPVAVDAVKLLCKVGIDVYKDLENERKEMVAMGAKAKYAKYSAYVDAGFSRGDAFKLVLAEIKPVNFTEALNKVTKEVTARLGK
jgi:hypothetical protein